MARNLHASEHLGRLQELGVSLTDYLVNKNGGSVDTEYRVNRKGEKKGDSQVGCVIFRTSLPESNQRLKQFLNPVKNERTASCIIPRISPEVLYIQVN